MSSPFDALDAALSHAVLAAFGETEQAMLRPVARSAYAVAASDPSRPARPVRGIFSAAPVETQPKGNAVGGEWSGSTRFSSSAAEFWISAADVAAIPYRIATGDRIEFPGRAGSPAYSVADLHQTSAGDLNLILALGDAE